MEIQEDREVQDIVSNDDVQRYIKNYQGYAMILEEVVINSFENGWATIGAVRINISMEAIVKANSLSLEARLLKQILKVKPKEIQALFNSREVLINKRTSIDRESLLVPWNRVTLWETK